jgi:hypothetical protein
MLNKTKTAMSLALLGMVASTVAACSSPSESGDLGWTQEAAKIGTDAADCFASCSQADMKTLLGKDPTQVTAGNDTNLVAACAKLNTALSDPKQNPPSGWNPKLPTCLGFGDRIKGRKDCNHMTNFTGWTDCNNELLDLCLRYKEAGFSGTDGSGNNIIIDLPPTYKPVWTPGSPAPGSGKSVTDQEYACTKQWSCSWSGTKGGLQPKDDAIGGSGSCPLPIDFNPPVCSDGTPASSLAYAEDASGVDSDTAWGCGNGSTPVDPTCADGTMAACSEDAASGTNYAASCACDDGSEPIIPVLTPIAQPVSVTAQ